jgi:hypothetical protein
MPSKTYTPQEIDTIVQNICKKLGWKWDGRKPLKKSINTLPHALRNDSLNSRPS